MTPEEIFKQIVKSSYFEELLKMGKNVFLSRKLINEILHDAISETNTDNSEVIIKAFNHKIDEYIKSIKENEEELKKLLEYYICLNFEEKYFDLDYKTAKANLIKLEEMISLIEVELSPNLIRELMVNQIFLHNVECLIGNTEEKVEDKFISSVLDVYRELHPSIEEPVVEIIDQVIPVTEEPKKSKTTRRSSRAKKEKVAEKPSRVKKTPVINDEEDKQSDVEENDEPSIAEDYNEPLYAESDDDPSDITTDDITLDNLESESYDSVGPNDAVRTYIKQIRRYEVLSPEEEREIARKVKYGNPEESKKATLEMINHNLRLVVSIAKRYQDRGLDFMDLVQEGNLGLMTAVERYDSDQPYKFSTYATWWIRQAITRAISNYARPIRVPVHMLERINKVRKIMNRFQMEFGTEPTSKEVADELGITAEKVEEILKSDCSVISINTFVGNSKKNESDATELGELLEDKRLQFEDKVIEKISYQQIVEAISKNPKIKPRTWEIFALRNGLKDGSPRTLEEIGQMFGVTRERVRQLEAKCLAIIKSDKNIINKEKVSLPAKGPSIPRNYYDDKREEFEKMQKNILDLLGKISSDAVGIKLFCLRMGYHDGRIYSFEEISANTGFDVKRVYESIDRVIKDIAHSPYREDLFGFDLGMIKKINQFIEDSKENYANLNPYYDFPLAEQIEHFLKLVGTNEYERKIFMLKKGYLDKKYTISEIAYSRSLSTEKVKTIIINVLHRIKISRYYKKFTDLDGSIKDDINDLVAMRARKREDNMSRPAQTIFQILDESDINKIAEAVKELSTSQQQLFYKRYGSNQEDWYQQPTGKLDSKEKFKLWGGVLKTLREKLNPTQKDAKTVIPKEQVEKTNKEVTPTGVGASYSVRSAFTASADELYDLLDADVVNEDAAKKAKEENADAPKPDEVTGSVVVEESTSISEHSKSSSETYTKLVKLLKTPMMMEMLHELDYKTITIFSIGMIQDDNGKHYTAEDIATFLGMTPTEVRERTIAGLKFYRDAYDRYFDSAIASLEKEDKTIGQFKLSNGD